MWLGGGGTGVVGAALLAATAERSTEVGPSWLVVPIVAVIVGVFWMSIRVSKGPKRGARDIGTRSGWNYVETDDAVLARFPGWPFTLGSDPAVSDVIRGPHRGRSTMAFTFSFSRRVVGGLVGYAATTLSSAHQQATGTADMFHGIDWMLGEGRGGSGTLSVGHQRTRVMIVAMEMPQTLPGLLVRCQMPTDRLMPGLRSGDLDLGDRSFDDAYLVRAVHPQLARDVLTPANRQRLLAFSPFANDPRRRKGVGNLTSDPADGFTMWTADRYLLLLTNAWLNTAGYDAAFDLMADFLDNIPSWVWDVAAGRGVPPTPPGSTVQPSPPIPQ